jgi:hypothetical protein
VELNRVRLPDAIFLQTEHFGRVAEFMHPTRRMGAVNDASLSIAPVGARL